MLLQHFFLFIADKANTWVAKKCKKKNGSWGQKSQRPLDQSFGIRIVYNVYS